MKSSQDFSENSRPSKWQKVNCCLSDTNQSLAYAQFFDCKRNEQHSSGAHFQKKPPCEILLVILNLKQVAHSTNWKARGEVQKQEQRYF